MEIRAMTLAEQIYLYPQSSQITSQTEQIGILDGEMGRTDDGSGPAWKDGRRDLKNDAFTEELSGVLNELRADGGLLHDKSSLTMAAHNLPGSCLSDGLNAAYGFRIDSGEYAFLLRCGASKQDNRYVCACYVSKWLDRHIREAQRGIRFITPQYVELFRIPDGGKILATDRDGTQREYTCRFIDECHLEVGRSFYHICELAERMAQNGRRCEPQPISYEPQKVKYNEVINRITVKKDGVYVSSHGKTDGEPFRSWKSTELSEAFAAGGKAGLDRAIIQMLCQGATLHGAHQSVEKYRYAVQSAAGRDIGVKCHDALLDRFYQMPVNDQISIWHTPTKTAWEFIKFEKDTNEKMYTALTDRCAEYDRKPKAQDMER